MTLLLIMHFDARSGCAYPDAPPKNICKISTRNVELGSMGAYARANKALAMPVVGATEVATKSASGYESADYVCALTLETYFK